MNATVDRRNVRVAQLRVRLGIKTNAEAKREESRKVRQADYARVDRMRADYQAKVKPTIEQLRAKLRKNKEA